MLSEGTDILLNSISSDLSQQSRIKGEVVRISQDLYGAGTLVFKDEKGDIYHIRVIKLINAALQAANTTGN